MDVLFEEMPGVEGNLGIITLNRPAALNALNHEMIVAMHTKLATWETQHSIKAVIIRAAEGRAFCAGGDLKACYQQMLAKNVGVYHFFRDEYLLNRAIFHFPKPYIAFLDGITMGGGAGISIHGSHRVATDRLVFAMPETGIGFFTDVGGTYFLSRLPHQIGFYLGLTGSRLTADDCIALGLADQKVSTADLNAVLMALAQQAFGQDSFAAVTNVLQNFDQKKTVSSSLLTAHAEMAQCFRTDTLFDALTCLQQSASTVCREAVDILKTKSPLSLCVTFLALKRAKDLVFDDCMQQEYRLVNRFLSGHDFLEGIRAVIIDKDNAPHWQPATLNAVSPEKVEAYFLPLAKELIKT